MSYGDRIMWCQMVTIISFNIRIEAYCIDGNNLRGLKICGIIFKIFFSRIMFFDCFCKHFRKQETQKQASLPLGHLEVYSSGPPLSPPDFRTKSQVIKTSNLMLASSFSLFSLPFNLKLFPARFGYTIHWITSEIKRFNRTKNYFNQVRDG